MDLGRGEAPRIKNKGLAGIKKSIVRKIFSNKKKDPHHNDEGPNDQDIEERKGIRFVLRHIRHDRPCTVLLLL
ncbi:MAG: hypothetical protein M1313_01655 [Nitrospirae bacterium]|nr:hypothetical protein [Nitrospirota bacterium]